MLYLFALQCTYRYLKDTIGDIFYRLSLVKKADKKAKEGWNSLIICTALVIWNTRPGLLSCGKLSWFLSYPKVAFHC